MLTAREFTVGALSEAQPVSLVLPRGGSDAFALVGSSSRGPVAAFLLKQHRFTCIATEGAENWRGIIVPNVRIEVDPTSAQDADRVDTAVGSIVRSGTELQLASKPDRGSWGVFRVTLEDGLPKASNEAMFTRWAVTLGTGVDKRTLMEVDTSRDDPASLWA